MTDLQDIPEHIHSQAQSWWNRREKGEPGIDAKLHVWLLADPRHRRAFEAVGDLWAASSKLGDLPVGRLRQLPRAPFYMRRNTHVAVAMTGAVACLIMVTTLTQNRLPFTPVTTAYAAEFSTRRGEIRSYEIQDGSSLVLDALSRAQVEHDGDAYRLTVLAGRVRMRPGRTEQRWLISAGSTRAHVLGTAFDVSILSSKPRLVAVESPVTMVGASGTMSLAPGEAAPLGCGSCQPERIAKGEVRWVSGMLVFEATPVDEAVRAINRYNTIQIRVPSDFGANRRITGAFRASNPQAFAEALAAMFDQKVSFSGADEIVLAPM